MGRTTIKPIRNKSLGKIYRVFLFFKFNEKRKHHKLLKIWIISKKSPNWFKILKYMTNELTTKIIIIFAKIAFLLYRY